MQLHLVISSNDIYNKNCYLDFTCQRMSTSVFSATSVAAASRAERGGRLQPRPLGLVYRLDELSGLILVHSTCSTSRMPWTRLEEAYCCNVLTNTRCGALAGSSSEKVAICAAVNESFRTSRRKTSETRKTEA